MPYGPNSPSSPVRKPKRSSYFGCQGSIRKLDPSQPRRPHEPRRWRRDEHADHPPNEPCALSYAGRHRQSGVNFRVRAHVGRSSFRPDLTSDGLCCLAVRYSYKLFRRVSSLFRPLGPFAIGSPGPRINPRFCQCPPFCSSIVPAYAVRAAPGETLFPRPISIPSGLMQHLQLFFKTASDEGFEGYYD